MKLFLDNNLPPALSRALHELCKKDGHTVTHLRERFAQDTTDVEWINTISSEGGWVAVSADISISRKGHEKQAWLESGLTIFFLEKRWLQIGYWNLAWKLVKWWPHIIEQAERITSGVGFRVLVSGARLKPLHF